MNDLIKLVEAEYRRDDLPEFRAGDTVKVHVLIKEGEKERIQQFQGVCIQRSGAGANKTFTVRKISNDIGVERIFPITSPNIDKVEVIKRGVVRQSRIFYLRKLSGKSAKIRERR